MIRSLSSNSGLLTSLILILVIGITSLVILNSISDVYVYSSQDKSWLTGQHLTNKQREDLAQIQPWDEHITKHYGETLNTITIREKLLTDTCVADRKYCDRRGFEMYLCQDNATGHVGALFVEIIDGVKYYTGGYGDGKSIVYWHDIAEEEGYKPCK